MVIIFQNEKARRHLLEEGFVVTFRKNKRKGVNLNDWMTDKRGGKKIADVKIFEMCGCDVGFLKSLVKWSGFRSHEEWKTEIGVLNKEETKDYSIGWLYLVVVRD